MNSSSLQTVILLALLFAVLCGCAYLLYRQGKQSAEKAEREKYIKDVDRLIKKAEEIRRTGDKHREALGGVDWDTVDKHRLRGAKSLNEITDAILRGKG